MVACFSRPLEGIVAEESDEPPWPPSVIAAGKWRQPPHPALMCVKGIRAGQASGTDGDSLSVWPKAASNSSLADVRDFARVVGTDRRSGQIACLQFRGDHIATKLWSSGTCRQALAS